MKSRRIKIKEDSLSVLKFRLLRALNIDSLMLKLEFVDSSAAVTDWMQQVVTQSKYSCCVQSAPR